MGTLMSRPVDIATRPQLALQSYLDALLQDATEEQALSSSLDEFEAAVLEEQARDTVVRVALNPRVVAVAAPAPVAVIAKVAAPVPALEPVQTPLVTVVEPVVEVHLPANHRTPPPLSTDGRPRHSAQPER